MRYSVVIPCYNAGRWIGEALRSVERQTCPAFEILVIDDGSTDDSVEQVKASGVEVQLLRTDRANGAGARNAGIRAAKGDWIAFLDADDFWYENHLERAGNLLGQAGAVAYLAKIDYTDLERTISPQPQPWGIGEEKASLSHHDYAELFARSQYFAMSSTVILRDRLLDIGGLDEEQVSRHDIDLWLRAIYDRSWCFDPVASVAYRQDTPGAISRDFARREYYFLRACLKNQEAYAGGPFEGLIPQAARRAMGSALTDGDQEDRRRARNLAWSHLRKADQALFSVAGACPWMFATLNRLRRWWIHR